MKQISDAGPFEVWWLKPAWAFAAAGTLVNLVAYLLPAGVYERDWKTPKLISGETVFYTLLSIACFCIGVWLINRQRQKAVEAGDSWQERIPWSTALLLFRFSVILCLAGYLVWALSAISRGVSLSLILGALTGEKGATYDLRDNYLNTISGVTTMTQFGVAAMILGVPLGIARGWKKVRIPLVAIFLLAALRAIVNSERLAAIELAVPFVVLYLSLRFNQRQSQSRLVRFAPLLGVAVVFVVFTACEYSRSWTTFYKGGDQNLVEFAGQRLLGYYVTAPNNTALLWRQVDFPLGAPYFTLQFLWRFPLVGQFVADCFPGLSLSSQTAYMDLLSNGANPEFNNTGGVLLPLLDFGIAGGLMCWLACGVVIGSLYSAFVRKTAFGLCLYPSLFIGLIEIPRILYWSDGRYFPPLCMLLVSALLLSRTPRLEFVLGWAEHNA